MIDANDMRTTAKVTQLDADAASGAASLDFGAGGFYALIPVVAVCDGCGAAAEMTYAASLDAIASRRHGFDAKCVAAMRTNARESASEEGWLAMRGRLYCPDCARSLGDGVVPRLHATDARGLVSDIATIARAKMSGRDS